MPEPVSCAVADMVTVPVPDAGTDGVVVGGELSIVRVIATVCAVCAPTSVATARSSRGPSGSTVVSRLQFCGVAAPEQTVIQLAAPGARCWIVSDCRPPLQFAALADIASLPLMA